MKVDLILCFDLYTGNQDFCFYGVGHTENEAIKNAKIPTRYEINEIFEECSIDDIPEEWTKDEEFMDILKHGYSYENE